MTSSKKQKTLPRVCFGNSLSADEVKDEIFQKYRAKSPEKSSCFKLITSPFKVCTVFNILNEDAIVGLLDELHNTEFTFKENDLLSLHQTIDLNPITTPFILAVKDFIYTSMKSIVERTVNCKFNNTIDLHGIKFMQHDNLLCHSDFLDSRHTAFILYLVPKTWSPDSGGLLELFHSDENNEPTSKACSLCPEFNSFSWFEVTKRSWHHVSEVLEDDIRLSISGWFHSDNIPEPSAPVSLPVPIPTEPEFCEVELLKSWISLKFLNLEVTSDIQESFQMDSEVSLSDFLLPEKYMALCAELSSMNWNVVGPRNKRNYKVSKSPLKTVEEFLHLLKTDAMAVLLSHCTGLALSRNYNDPECDEFTEDPFGNIKCSVQRWETGFYSMISDQDVSNLSETLHLFFHADLDPQYDVDAGGYISFISKESEEPLLVIPPQSNTLSLVFTRPDEFGFTKYINSKFKKPYYCFVSQYIPRKSSNETPEENTDLSEEEIMEKNQEPE